MTQTKIILAAVAVGLVVLAIAGVAFAQYVSSQNQNNPYYSQAPQQSYGQNPYTGYYPPNGANGYAPYPEEGGYSYGMGMGMMGRFW